MIKSDNIQKLVVNKSGINDFLSKVYNSVMAKVQGYKGLARGENFGHIWRFDTNPAHAGQVFRTKIQPNGNIKRTLVTAWAGNGKPLSLESVIFNRQGDVVSASNGFINASISKKEIAKINEFNKKTGIGMPISSIGTQGYISTPTNTVIEVAKNASKWYSASPQAQKLNYVGQVMTPEFYSKMANALKI